MVCEDMALGLSLRGDPHTPGIDGDDARLNSKAGREGRHQRFGSMTLQSNGNV